MARAASCLLLLRLGLLGLGFAAAEAPAVDAGADLAAEVAHLRAALAACEAAREEEVVNVEAAIEKFGRMRVVIVWLRHVGLEATATLAALAQTAASSARSKVEEVDAGGRLASALQGFYDTKLRRYCDPVIAAVSAAADSFKEEVKPKIEGAAVFAWTNTKRMTLQGHAALVEILETNTNVPKALKDNSELSAAIVLAAVLGLLLRPVVRFLLGALFWPVWRVLRGRPKGRERRRSHSSSGGGRGVRFASDNGGDASGEMRRRRPKFVSRSPVPKQGVGPRRNKTI
uniref:Uncharacterized protein n=1 Tax=Phaeomonas parva TaxID=124430 RepID=A0A7S1XM60_9STRA|mmetsp:Transcript_19405/g.58663  ORF Transcript_19405/g.58663 Transcript_19405/m.58663 type:complete len:287 (+) Transcript_19405:153-1013(+)